MTCRPGGRCLGIALAVLIARAGAGAGPSDAPPPAPMPDTLPGAEPHPEALARQLAAKLRERGTGYRPRTRHLEKDGSARYSNRLLLETSPYLLQHAHNPVDWYPWGDEAFAAARRLGRPVLLSVGYSTCHWCHVMEEESFEDEEVARLLNSRYVAIKVDREERPDVDAVYMSAVQAMTGGGGWPMTVWLTADRKPYYAGTYFPARDGDRGAAIGFLTLLERLAEAHASDPDGVASHAEENARGLALRLAPPPAAAKVPGAIAPGAAALHAAIAQYADRYDAEWGGVGLAPKFPSSLPVRLLLRYHRRTGDARALEMAATTLDRMAAGGIHDQVGSGFHRYATDRRWQVPHFEKMLYDNALLAMAYLEAYQVTGEMRYRDVVTGILAYVEREMTAPGGGFHSATDADSLDPAGRREEGRFFTWTPAEFEAALGAERARIAGAYFGVTAEGIADGRSVLWVPEPLPEVARRLGLAPGRVWDVVTAARTDLLRARASRPRPLLDDKVVVASNGLMISAHARAALALGEERHARAAVRAADFVLSHARGDGRLPRSIREGEARQDGFLDDHAFFIQGLLDLFEATGDRRHLERAMALDRILAARFEDREGGGFFMTAADQERLIARDKPSYDGAEPSGNSVATLNLLRLAALTSDDAYRVRAERTLGAFAALLEIAPAALAEMLLALDFHLDAGREIVIAVPGRRAEAEPFLAELRTTFLPNRVLVVAAPGPEREALDRVVPLVRQKRASRGRATAYVCRHGVCDLPTADPKVFARQLAAVTPLPSPSPLPSP